MCDVDDVVWYGVYRHMFMRCFAPCFEVVSFFNGNKLMGIIIVLLCWC